MIISKRQFAKEGVLIMSKGFFREPVDGEEFEVRGIGYDEGSLVRLSTGEVYDLSLLVHNDLPLSQFQRGDSLMKFAASLLQGFGWTLKEKGLYDSGGEALTEEDLEKMGTEVSIIDQPCQAWILLRL
jgi:hypothetical protein